MKKLLTLGLLLFAIVALSARVVRHKRVGKVVEKKPEVVAAVIDTLVMPPSTVAAIYGYDKPLRARSEVFFVKNNSADDINAMSLSLNYYDTSGRLLHRRSHRLAVAVPPGETRRAEIPTWDTNYSFYYKGSRPPRVSATPYNVTCTIDTLFVSPAL